MKNEKQNDERRKAAAAAAQECVRVLKENFDAREAYVFGSLRGDSPWNERSDVDIAVEGLAPGRYIDALVTLYELLPEGMELDLVPLERAVPELAALAKGEVIMPENPIEALKTEIQNELKNLARIVKGAQASFLRLRKPPSQERMMVFGKYVHDFYEGVERIFERIEKRMEVPFPIGESWHTLLLRQMEHEVQKRRPAVIDHALALRLHRYLRFRHLFRHTYGYELVWDELCPLVEGLAEVFESLQEQIHRFLDALTKTTQAAPSHKIIIESCLSKIREIQVLIPQYNWIYDYLLRHPDMIAILLPVCKAVKEKFRNQAQLSLEVYRDPEIDDEYLTLYVRQEEYDDNIINEIKKVRASFEELLAGKSGWLLTTTDFMAPKKHDSQLPPPVYFEK